MPNERLRSTLMESEYNEDSLATEIGLDRAKFEACLTGDARGGKYADHIESDYENASASGGTGTPYSIVIAPNLGPEVLTGSTRLKAGTATKLLLNTFTTLAMVGIGKTMSNQGEIDTSSTSLWKR